MMRSLKDANRRNEELSRKLKEIETSREAWRRSYWDIYEERSRLQSQLECVDCQLKSVHTKEGKTVELCSSCTEVLTDWKKKVKALKEQVEYWQKCYENLLEEHFKDDRRDFDGPPPRV